jgi:hypothetical protein
MTVIAQRKNKDTQTMRNLAAITVKSRTAHSTMRKESLNHGTGIVFYNNTTNNIKKK